MRSVFKFIQTFLVCLLPMLFSTLANARDADGVVKVTYACNVTSNTVIALEDGKPKTYSGIKDELAVGDLTFFNITYEPLAEWLEVKLNSKERENPQFYYRSQAKMNSYSKELQLYAIENGDYRHGRYRGLVGKFMLSSSGFDNLVLKTLNNLGDAYCLKL